MGTNSINNFTVTNSNIIPKYFCNYRLLGPEKFFGRD